ncbi:hypothetical protein LOD99_5612 [Oopsacas minuta]|uniref:Voltage-gated hydrogen channel 1 n=1 Tax=Oopsacas minuta TaxID=111878 RepID=A0AAV7JRP8_9METZ|nr:hypothetical protein LOD99_5612 [Oopsacas minuta]
MSNSHLQDICEERKVYFRSVRTDNRLDIDTNKLVSDFASVEEFQSLLNKSDTHNLDHTPLTPEGGNAGFFQTQNVDPRIKQLKNEWKYCQCAQKQYDYQCCIQFGFFRLKLQKILHSLIFHIIVSLLVVIDVLIVVLELTIETRQLAHCKEDEECEKIICNNTNTSTNSSEHIICGFVGLTHQCIPESEATPDVSRILSITSICILSIFFIEILIKIFAFGFRFFIHFFEVFDAVIITLSLMVDVVHLVFEENEFLILFELIIILRLWRIVRIITAAIAAYDSVKEGNIEKKIHEQHCYDAKLYLNLMKEYRFAKCELIRVREILVGMKVNPFPNDYAITKKEELCIGLN